MKVIVFGATGTIGKHVVQQALQQGHQVSAYCRDAQKLEKTKTHNRLRIIEGDVLDAKMVQEAMKGQDIVCIVLGSGKSRKSTVRSIGTKNIIKAMKAQNVQRLICQTTLGIGESNANLNFFWKRIMFGWYLKQIFMDHKLQEKYVMSSGLDWTIVRPGAFSDGQLTQNYRHGFPVDDRTVKLKISRADVADFILRQFSSKTYLFKMPGLSY